MREFRNASRFGKSSDAAGLQADVPAAFEVEGNVRVFERLNRFVEAQRSANRPFEHGVGDEIAGIERLFDAVEEEVVHAVERVRVLVEIELPFDVDLKLEPGWIVDARETHDLDVPAGPYLEGDAPELLVDGALKPGKELFFVDRAVERQADFKRLLFAAENFPERLLQEPGV